MKINRYVFFSTVGTAIEYYDFVIFAYLSVYIAKLFHPYVDEQWGLIMTFLTFACGYVARPFGGILFGFISDRSGRGEVLFYSIIMMSISTILIGILPTYHDLGKFSSLLLLLLRFVQGMSQGAEFTNALLYLNEQPTNSKQSNLGAIYSAASIGSILGLLTLIILKTYFTESEILAGLWRIPFITGGVLALIGLAFRYYTIQTHTQKSHNSQNDTSLLSACKFIYYEYHKEIIFSYIAAIPSALLIIFFVFLPTYISQFFHHDSSINFSWILIIGLLTSCIAIPLLENIFLTNALSPVRVFLYVIIALLLLIIPVSMLLYHHSYWSILCVAIFYQLIISLILACYPHIIIELFPAKIRGLSFSIIHNFSYIFASFLPSICIYSIKISNHKMAPIIVLFIVVAISLVLFQHYMKQIYSTKFTSGFLRI